ncbi:MAG: ATP synthase F1 subunit gamma [Lachnospiraceae bacterium]|nr:ATP synthase F1 subunit gamma [Lachnospiraceae bacterium]
MATMREIKRRKSSIQSTQQITKAMKVVSSAKLQKAKYKAESTKAYFNYMYETVSSMLAKSGTIDHPYLKAGQSEKKAVIAITSNRGLAGGYNSNIVKLITGGDFKKEDVSVYTIGRKGREGLTAKGYEIAGDYSDAIEAPLYQDAVDVGQAVLDRFAAGEIGEIYLAYTVFKNTVVHIPKLIKLLPVEIEIGEGAEKAVDDKVLMNYEPSEEEALDAIIPKYIYSLIYGAMNEAVASENGARMQAMDNATSNAEAMIDSLSLLYNRARQSSITQELTEIIAGADAVG